MLPRFSDQYVERNHGEEASEPRNRHSWWVALGIVLDSRLAELEAEIRNELQSIIDDHGACADRICLIVSVAEGADRILIEAAIALGIPFVCVLPCTPACFAEDFPTVESVETFQRQLALAIDIVGPAEYC